MEALYQQLNKKDFYCQQNFLKNVVFALILWQLTKFYNFNEILICKAMKIRLFEITFFSFYFKSRHTRAKMAVVVSKSLN